MSEANKKDSQESYIIPLENVLPPDLFLLPVKGRPVFPGIITPLVVPAGQFTLAMEEALRSNGYIGLVLLKDEDESNVTTKNIYKTGIVARVNKKINLPDGGLNILVNTIQRFSIQSMKMTEPFFLAEVKYPKESNGNSKNTIKALMRTLLILTKELAQNNPLFTEEMKLTMVNVDEPGKMADFVCSILNLEKEEYQSVVEATVISERLEKVILYLQKEIELISLQRKIQEQINEKIDKQQRQFFLKEQLKAIQNELGDEEDQGEKKYAKLLERLKSLKLDNEIVNEVAREVEKLSYSDPNSADYNVIRNYLDLIDALPWETPQQQEINLQQAKRILDRDHYKLDDVKERILEFLAVKKLNPQSAGTILCLVGPPGVGKTSIAKSVAEALGRKMFRFSVGGMRDEAEIKGHRRTYIGAMPGKIIQALKITREKNPVIVLDEIDKLGVGAQGDPASALLEVLDHEQNSSFRDHYLDLPFDLSKVLFIATANTLDTISRVLLDRLEVIRLSGYITEEKVQIFKKYLWKKELKNNGIAGKKISLDNKGIAFLINSYSRESGLRGLEKMTDKIARKLAYKLVRGEKTKPVLGIAEIETFLGPPMFVDDRMTKASRPGTCVGLAWTAYGGTTLLVEAVFIKGRAGLQLTGQLGKTMDESAKIALSFVRHLLADDIFQNQTLHIHVPDGATPKDGPSAGITMATAILSLALDKKMNPGFGMTGELTLTGEVLAIGGLREKLVAAKRAGIRKIIFPRDNKSNLKEIPDYVKKGITFYPVSHYDEIISLVFKGIPGKMFKEQARQIK